MRRRRRRRRARALEACARETLGEGGLTNEMLEETARATTTPSAASDDAATISNIETRLASTRAMLRGLGVDEAKTKAVMARAMDAWGGEIRERERIVDALETRLLEGDEDEEALNYILRRAVARLRVLKTSGARSRVGLRAVCGERDGVRRRGVHHRGRRGKVYAHREERPRWNVLLLRRRFDGDR